MKAQVYDLQGKKKSDIEMPAFFDDRIRKDIVAKCAEAQRTPQPYGLDPKAGRRHVASGIISHKRHDWKGQYGKGISRVPRKIMMRRGSYFNWVGAETSGSRGGRRPHGPKATPFLRKINKKEAIVGLHSALAATAQSDYVVGRYENISDVKLKLPIVIETAEMKKTKQIIALFKGIFGELFTHVLQHKTIRAGRGKTRGRKYKSNAGILVLIGKDEKFTMSGVDVRTVEDVEVRDLYPLGRLVVYTEKAVQELGAKK